MWPQSRMQLKGCTKLMLRMRSRPQTSFQPWLQRPLPPIVVPTATLLLHSEKKGEAWLAPFLAPLAA
jgi:hypothetical protein